jgi:transcription antitermination protein NusB
MTPRHQAREIALQALYAWEVGRADPDEALSLVVAEHWPDADDASRAFALMLVRGTTTDKDVLDRLLAEQTANWRLERFAVIDRLILRLALWELRQTDTPPAVVLNEAIELARSFGGDDSVRFVNGILDGIKIKLEGKS